MLLDTFRQKSNFWRFSWIFCLKNYQNLVTLNMKRKHWTNRAVLKTTLQVTKPPILAFLLNFWLFWREIDLSSLELKKSKDKIEEMPKSWKEGFVKARKEQKQGRHFCSDDFWSTVVYTSVSQCHIYPLEGRPLSQFHTF